MISVLAQERLLGAALGSAFTGIVIFEQRRRIYELISDSQPEFAAPPQIKEPIFGKKTRLELAHLWNKAVDQTFRPLIESLSSHGCLKAKAYRLNAWFIWTVGRFLTTLVFLVPSTTILWRKLLKPSSC